MAEVEKLSLKRSHQTSENEGKTWKEMKKDSRKSAKMWREIHKNKKLEKLLESQKSTVEIAPEKTTQVENSNGRAYTVSIAIPGSILDNAQSSQLRTYLAGQVARAAAIFNVDEIVVFDELGLIGQTEITDETLKFLKKCQGCRLLVRILQYLECPQYLRKYFFPLHGDLEFAGLLNPLDIPHHLRENEDFKYREGVVMNKPVKHNSGSFVYIGLSKSAIIDKALTPNVRVTVQLDEDQPKVRHFKGKAVSPLAPCKKDGIYWGYSVRLASSFKAIFSECPFKEGYDLTIGTSDNGENIDSFSMPSFKHLIIVFGGLKGLEYCLEADESLETDDPKLHFNYYLNTCPSQGSRTIRTEEAVLITLSALRPQILKSQGS